MPSRNELAVRAAAVGFDHTTIPNDSKLEQKLLYIEKRAAAITGTAPTTTLTSTGTAGNNETFTLAGSSGTRVYTLKTTLTGAADEVLIGAAATNTLDNIKSALNGTGTPGTDYGSDTVRNKDFTGGAKNATTLVIASTDTNANSAAGTTETMANFAFTGAAMSAGTLGSLAVPTTTYGGAAGLAGDANTSL